MRVEFRRGARSFSAFTSARRFELSVDAKMSIKLATRNEPRVALRAYGFSPLGLFSNPENITACGTLPIFVTGVWSLSSMVKHVKRKSISLSKACDEANFYRDHLEVKIPSRIHRKETIPFRSCGRSSKSEYPSPSRLYLASGGPPVEAASKAIRNDEFSMSIPAEFRISSLIWRRDPNPSLQNL